MYQKEKIDKQRNDKEIVRRILKGDERAWAQFVDRFTDWVFYRAKELCRKGGKFSQKYGEIKSKVTGKTYTYTEEELEVYIWIMKQLKNKLRSYTGKRGASLSTYIWAVLNSRHLFVDFLRWKYGDPRKIPKVLEDAPEEENKAFVLLRRRKTVEQIVLETGLSIGETEGIIKRIIEKLRSVGLEDMVLPFTIVENSQELIDTLPETTELSLEDKLILHNVYARLCQAVKKLYPEEQLLLRLFYNHKLNAGDILENYRSANMNLPGGISSINIEVEKVHEIIGKVRKKLLGLFMEMCKPIEGVVINNHTLMTFLKEVGVSTELMSS